MHKVTLLTLGLVAVLSSCSQRFDDSSLIRFDFKRISDVAPVDMTSQIVPERLSFQQGRCFILLFLREFITICPIGCGCDDRLIDWDLLS